MYNQWGIVPAHPAVPSPTSAEVVVLLQILIDPLEYIRSNINKVMWNLEDINETHVHLDSLECSC